MRDLKDALSIAFFIAIFFTVLVGLIYMITIWI